MRQRRIKHNGSTCFGKNYTVSEINEAILSSGGSKLSKSDKNYIQSAATLLAEGKTIGWFQLGSEFGPRALGRRSILADPRIKNIQSHINRDIKLREDFRPFAPAVLWEDRNIYFQNEWDSPYMILVDQIKEEWKNKLPGVVHVDGSCRIQTVKEEQVPFYELLKAFKKLTGIGVLLNTSFNRKAMPIIETPQQAIQFFYESGLDALVLNDYIFTKSL